MKIRTRLHDPASGAYVRDVSTLDFGSVLDGAATVPLVLSLLVEGVQKISGVSFVVEDSKSVDLDSGALDVGCARPPDDLVVEPCASDTGASRSSVWNGSLEEDGDLVDVLGPQGLGFEEPVAGE